MDKQIKRMGALANYMGEDRVITLEEKRAELEKEGLTPWVVKSDIPTLDNTVEGFRPGNLIVISAPTANGKTTLCQTITRNISRQGITSLWFPFEGDVGDFLERLDEVTMESTMPAYLKSSNLAWIRYKGGGISG